MDGAIIAQVLLISAGVLGGRALSRWRVRRRSVQLTKRVRREYADRYDPSIEPRLSEYIECVIATFGQEFLAQPVVDSPPVQRNDRVAVLRETIAVVAQRFALEFPPVTARFVPSLPDGAPAQVRWDQPWEAVLEGSVVRIRSRELASENWQILVQEHYRYDDELLAALVAHEVAHVALLARGVRLPDRRHNEELTDTAAVLAGFGPLLWRASYRETQREAANGKRYIGWRRIGYLHQQAIEFLMERRAVLARG